MHRRDIHRHIWANRPRTVLRLDIPDDFARRLETRLQAAEAELHLGLAVVLYRAGSLPLGRAAVIAGVSEPTFAEILQ